MLIMKQIIPQLKKEMILIFLWLIIFFLSEKHNWESLALMYVITFRWSLLLANCLKKIIHEEWWEALIIDSSFSEDELEIDWIMDYRDSWMKMISKFVLFSKIRSKRRQFLWMFCKDFWGCIRLLFQPAYTWVNWIGFNFSELLRLLIVPIIVEFVFLEEIVVAVCLVITVRNKPATEPVILKVCNVKLNFDIWLVLYMYFILYSWQSPL